MFGRLLCFFDLKRVAFLKSRHAGKPEDAVFLKYYFMKETKMKNFTGLGLNPIIAKSLAYMKYDTPTPIQAKAIPLALDGRDIMGSAQTGTGKTAAFAIPLIEKLLSNPKGTALVLTPTRELGKQVLDVMHQLLGKDSGINTAFLIGGDSMQKQNNQLSRKPRLVVGTPGRINDHLERKNLKLHETNFLVLDETDRMLDMGFSVQLDRIFKYLPKHRQTLMFSATMPGNIMQMADKYLNNAERISVGSTITPAKNIKQEVIRVTDNEKYQALLDQLETRAGTIIMFVKTKYGTERMAKRLKALGYDADAIHGDLKQSRRTRVLNNFRDMKFQILVATDVAARGLDIPHIEHVINYDLPQVPEDFIHRIGRTARAGAEGHALSFVSPQDGRKWHAIEMLLDPTKKSSSMPNKGAAKHRGKSGGKFSDKKPYGKKKPFGQNRSRSSEDRDEKRFGKKPFSKSKKGGAFAGKPSSKPYGKKPFNKSSEGEEKRTSNSSDSRSDKPFKYAKKKAGYSERSEKSQDAKRTNGGKFEGKHKPRPSNGSSSSEGQKKWSSDKPSGKPSYKSGDKPLSRGKKPFSKGNSKPSSSMGESSEKRQDGKSFTKKKSGNGGFKKPGGFKSSGGFKGANKFGGGPNKARGATGGGKRPKSRRAS